jgi:hypothetical protein
MRARRLRPSGDSSHPGNPVKREYRPLRGPKSGDRQAHRCRQPPAGRHGCRPKGSRAELSRQPARPAPGAETPSQRSLAPAKHRLSLRFDSPTADAANHSGSAPSRPCSHGVPSRSPDAIPQYDHAARHCETLISAFPAPPVSFRAPDSVIPSAYPVIPSPYSVLPSPYSVIPSPTLSFRAPTLSFRAEGEESPAHRSAEIPRPRCARARDDKARRCARVGMTRHGAARGLGMTRRGAARGLGMTRRGAARGLGMTRRGAACGLGMTMLRAAPGIATATADGARRLRASMPGHGAQVASPDISSGPVTMARQDASGFAHPAPSR